MMVSPEIIGEAVPVASVSRCCSLPVPPTELEDMNGFSLDMKDQLGEVRLPAMLEPTLLSLRILLLEMATEGANCTSDA